MSDDRVNAMVSKHATQATDRELARIADCAENLCEWQQSGNGCAVTIDRRAVVMVADPGMDGGCVVTLGGGCPVALLDSYADVVAWWRGVR